MIRFIRATNLGLVLVIIVAHFFAPAGYVITLHTMSELAGQGLENAWILTSGFWLAGLGYVVFSTLAFRNQEIPYWLYGLTISNGVMTFLLGIFPTSYDGLIHVPVIESIVIIHRYIAYTSNLITVGTIIVHIFKSTDLAMKRQHTLFLLLAIVFSGLFIFYNQDVRGIFQRLILLTTTIWTWTSYAVWKKELPTQKHQQTTMMNR
jgi:hypothetical membrane protein